VDKCLEVQLGTIGVHAEIAPTFAPDVGSGGWPRRHPLGAGKVAFG